MGGNVNCYDSEPIKLSYAMTPRRAKLLEKNYVSKDQDLHFSSNLNLKDSMNKLSGSKRK